MSGEPELEFANSQIEGHLEFIEVTLILAKTWASSLFHRKPAHVFCHMTDGKTVQLF